MQLMQRLGSDTNPQYIASVLDVILKYPGSCDNVWFPTLYGFPPIEKHKETAEAWKVGAEIFRKNGISVSLQLSNSIGHGQYIANCDCTGLVYENSPVQNLVGHDGTVARYCFCWRGEVFKRYVLDTLAIYSEIKPDHIWIDDDFRAINHAPVEFGCFCDHCIAEFNRRYQTDFTREALVQEILFGDISVREHYVEFLREGLSALMREMGETIHRISPETTLSYQHGAYGAFSGHGMGFIYDTMKEATGKIPFSRPGGGNYDAHDSNETLKKAVYVNWQNAMLPAYVERKCPEIENLPYVVFGKTPESTAFETTHYLANGNTDMTYAMIMNMEEPMEWHEKEFRLFAEHRKYWEKLSEYNIGSHQAGLRFFISKETWRKRLRKGQDMRDLNREPWSGMNSMIRDAIPVAYDQNDTAVTCLFPEAARYISVEELEELLRLPVVTDGESIAILNARGFKTGISSDLMSEMDSLSLWEAFTDHPVSPKMAKHHYSSRFCAGRTAPYQLSLTDTNDGELFDEKTAEILGIYTVKTDLEPNTKNPDAPNGIAEMIIQTRKGAKWAILGYSPWKYLIPTYKRDHILDITDYISENALAARLVTPMQAVLLPRKNADGKTVCVSITNCTIGESGDFKLLIRNPIGEKFTFMSQYDGEKTLSFEKIGEDYLLTVPSLHPWSVGTVFVHDDIYEAMC